MSPKDRLLLHYSDPINWRLRNLEKHPIDPGWEVGTYSVCHPHIRALTIPKTKILDVVVKEGKPVIRSAFVVNRIRGKGIKRVLHFDYFYFADADPIELPSLYIQYRCMTMEKCISKYNLKTLWSDILKEYTRYIKGQRPRSIDSKSWNSMVEKTSRFANKNTVRKK
jgi:hypothetical protein